MHRIPWNLTRTVAPTGHVLTPADLLGEAGHLRQTVELEAVQVEQYIAAAEEALEDELAIALLPQTWVLRLQRFPSYEMPLPRSPVTAVSQVQYVDPNGATQVLGSTIWAADLFAKPFARVVQAYGQSWPSVRDVPNAVIVTFTAGYADVAAVPARLKEALKRTVADLYENRERSAEQALREVPFWEALVANHRSTADPCYL